MPELPEVETVRRMLAEHVTGRTIQSVKLSGLKLRGAVARGLPRSVAGRTIDAVRRHGKYLLVDLSGGLTLISHLGMSGRWLFYTDLPDESQKHVHARFAFADGTTLWYQDPRRFGVLKVVATEKAMRDPALEILGPDPIANPPDGAALETLARGAKVAVKNFLLDQRRIAGVGNIYASEILHRAGVDPRRRAGTLRREEWNAIARETTIVLEAAIARMGTTFSMYRTLWNEPGSYADRLLVYDRAGEACRNCGTSIRRIVQGQRSTYFCPTCQPRRVASSRPKTAPARRRARPVPA